MPYSDELPPARPGAHRHVCRCGNYFTCHALPDQCPIAGISTGWICPGCEVKALDEYYDNHPELTGEVDRCPRCGADKATAMAREGDVEYCGVCGYGRAVVKD